MALADVPVDKIRPDDVTELVSAQVQEGRRLEYKREPPAPDHDSRRDFLRDLTAFANAGGGLTIYGIEEDGGLPSKVVGVATADLDVTVQRLHSAALTGIEPRVPSLSFAPLSMDENRTLLLQRVGRSWIGPHAVVESGRLDFWARHGAQKQRMDMTELRRAFTESSGTSRSARSFHDERLAAIATGEPMALAGPY